MEYSTYKHFDKIFEVKLKKLIANDYFLEAIQEFKAKVDDKQIENDFILMENRYCRILKDNRNGLI